VDAAKKINTDTVAANVPTVPLFHQLKNAMKKPAMIATKTNAKIP